MNTTLPYKHITFTGLKKHPVIIILYINYIGQYQDFGNSDVVEPDIIITTLHLVRIF
jgi:hypothetical protein